LTTEAGVVGSAPIVSIQPINPEASRYRQLWEMDEYRRTSPGEEVAALFLEQARPKPDAEVIDFGCGTGRGGLMLALMGGMKVTLLDFADNCLDEEVAQACQTQPERIKFVRADLTQPIPVTAAYGFCCDVLEHIPTDDVPKVLSNILSAANHVFLNISTEPDNFGPIVFGKPLHLTVRPLSWWLEQLKQFDVTVHWSLDMDGACAFYVSAWMDGSKVVEHGELNCGEDTVRANVKHNIAAGWQQVEPHATNDVEVMIVGGGPTLNGFVDEIRQKRAEGVKLIALNGAYNWCLEHDLAPSAVVVVDARKFNARFTKPVVDGCKYLIASQCDPEVLEELPKDRTYLWHTTAEMIRDLLDEQYELWWGVPGGSTVLLRSIPLLRMLGFKRFHLYGCDSCLGKDHHAYAQPENDSEVVIPVTVSDGRVFRCHPWMVAQAQEFMDLIKFLGDELEIATYGDGLLNHILVTGSKLAED
jgi:SAM-dependent methyltransferase